MTFSLQKAKYATLLAVILLAPANALFAQVQPTSQQLRQLQQLPPELRDRALEALRQSAQQQGVRADGDSASSDDSSGVAAADIAAQDSEPDVLRVQANSRLIVTMTPYALLADDELETIEEDAALSGVQGSHYYQLDDDGVLVLPGLQSVPLLGLQEEAVVERLGAIPSLHYFEISVTILEEEPIGPQALEPFGYEIFEPEENLRGSVGPGVKNKVDGFDPSTAGPVPPDYLLGPGDVVRFQLYGNEDGIYEFEISRSGELNLPRLGPIVAAGIPFSELRTIIRQRVEEMLIGTQVSVTMGELRSIRVFILGDANRPGSYVVSSLATISSALYRSGGISRIGSLRKIQLKRKGKLVANFDLYDLLLSGDTSNDSRLQPGDVIFVPPIGTTIGVSGAVKRPAIYEIDGTATISEAVKLAGGMLPNADPAAASLERIQTGIAKRVLTFDLAEGSSSREIQVQAGDLLKIPTILPDLFDSVALDGHVHRPGVFQWREGMKLTDLVPSALTLKPGADVNYIMIRRENARDRSIQILSADLGAALRVSGSNEDVLLEARDTVYVFDLAFDRQRVVRPILDELRLQSRFGNPYHEVHIAGFVRAPGAYPLEPGMRISDLIRAGGDMEESAYSVDAELTRYEIVDGEYRGKQVVNVDLSAILQGDPAADLELFAHDHLSISLVPDWDSDWSVTVEGEVRFPGEYQILRGETLSQLIQRAGGMTDRAFADGAVFLRESLKQREREQIAVLARRMESDLVSLSLQALDTTGERALSVGKSLLEQLEETDPVGRLVIDVSSLRGNGDAGNPAADLELRNGDRLMIPTVAQEVTVIGEAQYNTSHLYQPGLTREDYIALSGGLTRQADKKLIYIVRANGSVVTAGGSGWFGRGRKTHIGPGDTIVVPLDTDRIRPLTFWTNVTQILYQGAIAVAAVATFDN